MTDDPDRVFVEGTVHPNKTALQFYVPSDTATERAFPFARGDEYRGMTIQGTEAVILWPKGLSPEFPVEIEDCPDELVPWPLDESQPSPCPSREQPNIELEVDVDP